MVVMAVPLPDCVSLDGPLYVVVLVSSSVSQETQLLQAKAMFLPMDTPSSTSSQTGLALGHSPFASVDLSDDFRKG